MEDEVRIKFDIAWAIAVAQGGPQLLHSFPERLALTNYLQEMLEDCVDYSGTPPGPPKLKDNIPDAYQVFVGDDHLRLAPNGQIFVGGSGVTIQLFDEKLRRSYALKVPRVSVLAYRHPDFQVLDIANWKARLSNENKAFDNERQIARSLSHENIARHLYGSHKSLPEGAGVFPFSISEWIDGAVPLHKYLLAQSDSLIAQDVTSLILQSFAALAHVHSRNVVHWDIKSDNVLVASSGVLKLIDFGNAKLLDGIREDDRIATTTKGKYPPIPVLKIVETGQNESRRFRVEMPDTSWNHPTIDLWMMAQEWNRNLAISPAFCSGESNLTATEQTLLHRRLFLSGGPRAGDCLESLRLIFERVLFPFESKLSSAFIRPDKSFDPANLYYAGADEVVSELSRISPTFGAAQSVPELLVSLDDIVRLPVTGNGVFTERIARVADSKIVKPTKRHYQLGQVREVFPGASHLRYEHLLGTVSTTAYFLRSLYLNEMNSFWRISATEEDVSAVLFASILHDVGHLAFGHFVEEMGDLVVGAKHSDYVTELLTRCISRLEQSEIQARNAVFVIGDDELEEFCDIVSRFWVKTGLDPDRETKAVNFLTRVKAIFQSQFQTPAGPTHLSRLNTRAAMNGIMKSVIDGPIDADKLDYLRRDALHSGVYFSQGIDLERFFESVRACVGTSIDATHVWPSIGVSEKGIAPVETIITARYHLYSVVYWHRTVRCITAMLQRVISEIRLANDDPCWAAFFKEFLNAFRRLDDQQALEWLRDALSAEGMDGLVNRSLSTRPLSVDKARVSTLDVLEALLGDRRKYFHMAYELSYLGPVGDAPQQGMLPREQLHDAVCAKAHPGVGKASIARAAIRDFREELEKLFSAFVSAQGHKFEIDTILLDVPEPEKDQIRKLFVDRRSKRLLRTQPLPAELQSDGDFSELSDVSPIAASLGNVFRLWARKVRIYMTDADLLALKALGYSAGDVAALWEKMLFDATKINPAPQRGFRFP